MKNAERLIVGSIFALLVFAWLGFLLHVSPRFAGSGIGAVFAISAAVLMLGPLAYTIVKRIPYINVLVTRHVSMQTWMAVHVYTGILGALLAVIHTGHKYESPVGIALTATMMLAIVSGVAVRYLLPFVNLAMKDKLVLLQTARGDLDNAWSAKEEAAVVPMGIPTTPWASAGAAAPGLWLNADSPANRVTMLAQGVADLEYSVRADQVLRRWFSRALKLHIVLSVFLYALLAAHIASGIYFGLRWLR